MLEDIFFFEDVYYLKEDGSFTDIPREAKRISQASTNKYIHYIVLDADTPIAIKKSRELLDTKGIPFIMIYTSKDKFGNWIVPDTAQSASLVIPIKPLMKSKYNKMQQKITATVRYMSYLTECDILNVGYQCKNPYWANSHIYYSDNCKKTKFWKYEDIVKKFTINPFIELEIKATIRNRYKCKAIQLKYDVINKQTLMSVKDIANKFKHYLSYMNNNDVEFIKNELMENGYINIVNEINSRLIYSFTEWQVYIDELSKFCHTREEYLEQINKSINDGIAVCERNWVTTVNQLINSHL